jgi:hypothetical protein
MEKAEAISFLAAAITEAQDAYGGSFREVCLGIEEALKVLRAKGRMVSPLRLEFGQDGVRVADLELSALPKTTKTKGYHVEGVWFVLYGLCMPHHITATTPPLRITSLTLTYGQDPSVTYDARQAPGIPLALDIRYDPQRFLDASKPVEKTSQGAMFS